ncbi:Zn-dependent oligopeptidase [Bacillus thuringiensis]|uniref:Zn-dependent oligopeptidase n=1 Tax=Bacillus thuringiensis TaxID=1428 RepID=UPI00119F0422|nr:Zn-dependent oligopeptidase [Bacillus thuringiensis]
MNIQEQVKQEDVKHALYEYAMSTSGKEKGRFLKENMHEVERGVEPGMTRLSFPSITSEMNWGQGDVTVDIHHDSGIVKVYEQDIDGENWSKSSLQLKGEKAFSDVIKEQTEKQKETHQIVKNIPKELETRYRSFVEAKRQEDEYNTDSMMRVMRTEDKYTSLRKTAIEQGVIAETSIQRMEYNVEQSFEPLEPLKTKDKVMIPQKTPKDAYKESYKEQVIEEITLSQEEERYKEQFKEEVLEILGVDKEKSSDSKEQVSKEEKKEARPGPQVEMYTKSREERVKEMKEFEKTHSYPEVYRLKKEALQELKGLNLTDSQREKLTNLEKTLDQEKQDYDKNSKKESGQEKEPKNQNKFAQLFHQFKGVKKKEQPKETEMERS